MRSSARTERPSDRASASATSRPRDARPALAAARCVVAASEALEQSLAESDVSPHVVDALEAVRALAGIIAPLASAEASGGRDGKEERTTTALRRRVDALERALRDARAREGELEREVIEGRSAWFAEAKKELDAALRSRGLGGDRERELGREVTRLASQCEQLRAECVELEDELVRSERARTRLERENAILLDAARAARKEFERRDMELESARARGAAVARAAKTATATTPTKRVGATAGATTAATTSPSNLPAYLGSPFGGVRLRD